MYKMQPFLYQVLFFLEVGKPISFFQYRQRSTSSASFDFINQVSTSSTPFFLFPSIWNPVLEPEALRSIRSYSRQVRAVLFAASPSR